KGHDIWRIGYSPTFHLGAVEQQLRKELDGAEWTFVTIGQSIEWEGRLIPTFGMAPILPRSLAVAYHATRACVIDRICNGGEDLLPSNAQRRATKFPDTDGVIHVCAKLTHSDDDNDRAEWWRATLSENNELN